MAISFKRRVNNTPIPPPKCHCEKPAGDEAICPSAPPFVIAAPPAPDGYPDQIIFRGRHRAQNWKGTRALRVAMGRAD